MNFVSQELFQLRPNWVFSEHFNKTGGTCAFTASLEFNTDIICKATGQNKKDAKITCAKNAIGIVAPNVFKDRWPGEEVPTVEYS